MGFNFAILQLDGNIECFIEKLQIWETGLAKTVASSFKNLPDRLSRPASLFSSKSWRSFNTVSSDATLNLNFDLGYFRIFWYYCRTEFKPSLKEGGDKLASKLSASVQKNFLKC